jgi:hypothetical protein
MTELLFVHCFKRRCKLFSFGKYLLVSNKTHNFLSQYTKKNISFPTLPEYTSLVF